MINRDVQRLFDLVRYCRAELHQADLITDEEYAELLTEAGSVDRLHKYDRQQAEVKELTAERDSLKEQVVQFGVKIEELELKHQNSVCWKNVAQAENRLLIDDLNRFRRDMAGFVSNHDELQAKYDDLFKQMRQVRLMAEDFEHEAKVYKERLAKVENERTHFCDLYTEVGADFAALKNDAEFVARELDYVFEREGICDRDNAKFAIDRILKKKAVEFSLGIDACRVVKMPDGKEINVDDLLHCGRVVVDGKEIGRITKVTVGYPSLAEANERVFSPAEWVCPKLFDEIEVKFWPSDKDKG